MIIPLTNVANAQTINVTLNNVNGSTNVTIPMRLLIGDTNGGGFVDVGDAQQTRNRCRQTTDATDFRSNVDAEASSTAGGCRDRARIPENEGILYVFVLLGVTAKIKSFYVNDTRDIF